MRTLHKMMKRFISVPLLNLIINFIFWLFRILVYTSTGTMHCHFLESCLVLAKVLFSLRFCLRYIHAYLLILVIQSHFSKVVILFSIQMIYYWFHLLF